MVELFIYYVNNVSGEPGIMQDIVIQHNGSSVQVLIEYGASLRIMFISTYKFKKHEIFFNHCSNYRPNYPKFICSFMANKNRKPLGELKRLGRFHGVIESTIIKHYYQDISEKLDELKLLKDKRVSV
jgi:hypothetical protein